MRPWALVGIVVAGAVLRVWHLGSQSYWFDEAATLDVLKPTLHGTWLAVKAGESTPPLYYGLAWVWKGIFGDGTVGLRSLSVVAGTAAIPLAWAGGRELASTRAGLFAAGLVAVNPMLIWYSQEARSYSLLVGLAALSCWLVLRAWRRPSHRTLAAWSASASLVLLTHYYGAFLLFAEAAFLLWALPRARRLVAWWLVPVGAVGAALVPLAQSQEAHGRTAWIHASPLSGRLGDVAQELLTANAGLVSAAANAPPRTWGLIGALGVAGALVAIFGLAGVRDRRAAALAFGLGAVALMIPLALAYTSLDYFKDRNLIAAWIAFALAAGAGLAGTPRAVVRWAAVAMIGVAGVAVTLTVADDPNLQRTDWRGAIDRLGRPTHTRAVLVTPGYATILLRIYGHDLAPLKPGTPISELDTIGQGSVAGQAGRLGTFVAVDRQQVQQVALVRYRSRTPVTLTASQLAQAPSPLQLELSTEAAGWVTRAFQLVTGWFRDSSTASPSPAARQRLAGADIAVRALGPAPVELPRAGLVTARLHRAADAAVRFSRTPLPATKLSLQRALTDLLRSGS